METNIDLSTLKIEKISDLEWRIIIEYERVSPTRFIKSIPVTKIVEFNYYKDESGYYWLSNCSVPEEYQKQGIGVMMIKHAIKAYGQVYFSNASHLEFNIKYPNHGYDSRYLTYEGKKMVESLIRKNIVPIEWYRSAEI
jgi:hypothetical protein